MQTVEKTAAILMAFTAAQPRLRVSEVARLCRLGQSTASRLLSTLEGAGFVERDLQSGLYELGPEILTLAGIALNASPISRASRQVAQDLAASTRLGANVAIRRGDGILYLLNFEGRDAPRSLTHIGRRNPLYATALGKSLLAGLSDEAVEALLAATPLSAFTLNTITEVDPLIAHIRQVRERGYSTEREELALGRGCVAAPIRDQSGAVVAAISISGPLSALRLDQREVELARLVIESADYISASLGHHATARELMAVAIPRQRRRVAAKP